MAINVDTSQALALLGAKTLENEQLKSQFEGMTEAYNKLMLENKALQVELDFFKKPGMEMQQALREVK